MPEVLVQFDEPHPADDGRLFVAQVNGRHLCNGLWEAWIEFHPRDGGEPVRTGRETEQLTRGDLRFWAAGITRAYLAAALRRAVPSTPLPAQRFVPMLSLDDSWEDDAAVLATSLGHTATPPLNPVEMYRRAGEHRLRNELRALSARELRHIMVAYDIPELEMQDTVRTYEDALAERIVAAVQQVVRTGATSPSRSMPQQL